MTRTMMNRFLNNLIKCFPGYKARIFDKEAFVKNWMEKFGDQDEELMNEAAQIWVDGNRFFPTTEEFTRSLLVANSRRTVREQEEYERTHPTPPEDQAIVDAVIRELFEGEDND